MKRMRKLKLGTVVQSPATGKRFLIANRLGEGGYGCTYRVQRLDSWDRRIKDYCLKTTTDEESWHREAYFGELLHPCDRAIRLYESFPLFPATRRHGLLYCLVTEYAEHGTIRDHLANDEKVWSPERARREIVALLKLLDQLHGAGALHRDITPTNVFVCKNNKLKLGDFGLARTVLAGKMLAASAFTPFFVSKRMAEGERRHWLPSDDVFQMGQLLAMLLRGDAESVISSKDVGELSCTPDLPRLSPKPSAPGAAAFRRRLTCCERCKGTTTPRHSRLRAWKERPFPSRVFCRFVDLTPRSSYGRLERRYRNKSRVGSTSSSRAGALTTMSRDIRVRSFWRRSGS